MFKKYREWRQHIYTSLLHLNFHRREIRLDPIGKSEWREWVRERQREKERMDSLPRVEATWSSAMPPSRSLWSILLSLCQADHSFHTLPVINHSTMTSHDPTRMKSGWKSCRLCPHQPLHMSAMGGFPKIVSAQINLNLMRQSQR